VHAGISVAMRYKMTHGNTGPLDELVRLTLNHLDESIESAVLDPEDTPEEMKRQAEGMLRLWIGTAAPALDPIAVELDLHGIIGGVRVHGRIDILTAKEGIVDIKTAAKKPCGLSASHGLQIATYAALAGGLTSARIDTLTKTKTAGFHQNTVQISPQMTRYAETMYTQIGAEMQEGRILPNRGSMLCSHKHCPFASECESEYGGEVKQ
jgi:RecB family exonuclease